MKSVTKKHTYATSGNKSRGLRLGGGQAEYFLRGSKS